MYQIENPIGRVQNGLSQAAGTYGSMTKNIPGPEDPGPTAGGGIMAGLGGATMAATIAGTEMGGASMAAMGLGGPMGLAVGAGLGLAAYLFS